jgi:hypothetical protein
VEALTVIYFFLSFSFYPLLIPLLLHTAYPPLGGGPLFVGALTVIYFFLSFSFYPLLIPLLFTHSLSPSQRGQGEVNMTTIFLPRPADTLFVGALTVIYFFLSFSFFYHFLFTPCLSPSQRGAGGGKYDYYFPPPSCGHPLLEGDTVCSMIATSSGVKSYNS